jgi:hypothetical protein
MSAQSIFAVASSWGEVVEGVDLAYGVLLRIGKPSARPIRRHSIQNFARRHLLSVSSKLITHKI